MYQKFFENYCIIFFSIIPITILIGSSASLLNIVMICLLGLVNIIFIYKQGYNLFKSLPVKLILLLYIYLIFNSFIALDFEMSAKRNFGFFRYLIFFITCNYFFFISKKSEKVFIFWLIIILIVIFDVFLESVSGRNMLGYGELYGRRIVSFFKTEPVVGFYIYSFFLSLLGFLFMKYKNYNDYKKVLIILFSIIGFISILLTGERSNTIKCLIAIILFYFINDNFSYKKKILFVMLTIIICSLSIKYIPFLELRYKHQVYNIFTQEHQKDKIQSNLYVNLYLSAYKVFRNYPIFGVGNKNYRVETCNKGYTFEYGAKEELKDKYNYLCVTHPHQIYFEFLAEHGLVGTIILLSIFFYLIFKNLKIIILSKNYIQIGCFIYLILNFIPILPGGSFFSDFKSTLFWLNLSIMYSVSKDTNIFYLLKNIKDK